MQQGADNFWDAFELVGVEAKVISDGPSAVAGKTAGTAAGEAKPAGVGMPPAEPAPPQVPCDPKPDTKHTPKLVDVVIADSYGNDKERNATGRRSH